jgi:hypothetical protein
MNFRLGSVGTERFPARKRAVPVHRTEIGRHRSESNRERRQQRESNGPENELRALIRWKFSGAFAR